MTIKTWDQFLVEKEKAKHDFSSTQINLPKDIAKRIIKWGKDAIPNEDVYDVDEKFGREDEVHATLLYGIHSESPKEVFKILSKEKPIEFGLGRISAFATSPDYDVVKIEVISRSLHGLHALLAQGIKHSNAYPTYQPHVTISYVKKGKAKKHIGETEFRGVTIPVKEIVFSSKDGSKTIIPLGTS